jgi:hypothetical protein
MDYAAAAKTSLESIKEVIAGEGWVEFEHKGAKDVKASKRALPGKSVEIVKVSGGLQIGSGGFA